jgi:hypothetical protein
MALKNRDINPLAVANMRRMEFCPPHFESLTVDLKCNEKTLTDWIYENTDGRFFVQKTPALATKIGFEVHAEATYLAMFLNQINVPSLSF